MERQQVVDAMQHRRSIRDHLKEVRAPEVDAEVSERFETLVSCLEDSNGFRPAREDDGRAHGYLDTTIGERDEMFAIRVHVGYAVEGGMHIPQEVSVTFLDQSIREIIATEAVNAVDLKTRDPEALRMLELLEQTVEMIQSEHTKEATTS